VSAGTDPEPWKRKLCVQATGVGAAAAGVALGVDGLDPPPPQAGDSIAASVATPATVFIVQRRLSQERILDLLGAARSPAAEDWTDRTALFPTRHGASLAQLSAP
jgi:hypothetical protein